MANIGYFWQTVRILTVTSLIALVGCNQASTDVKTVSSPNILLIVADDMGFADVTPFGGEIPTPNIENLAQRGVRLTRFYTSALCSPSRAMLLSGSDNHLVGLGAMGEFGADNQMGLPGYEGYLKGSVVTLGEALRDMNYNTYMVGKWHMGPEMDQSPVAQGFDRSFAMIGAGASSHFNDMIGPDDVRRTVLYREDRKTIYHLPDNFYSTDYFTDKMIDYIDAGKENGKPFFAYVAYTAPHWPMQAKGKYLEKFRGKYDKGYEVLFRERFEKLKKMGIIPAGQEFPKRPDRIAAWNSLTAQEKKAEARVMEVYAGMVANMDANIGRIVSYLERTGKLDNTFIFFMSDNGADGFTRTLKNSAVSRWIDSFDNSLGNLGKKGSFAIYHPGWAWAGATPFRLTKGFPAEGGIRSPAIAVFPKDEKGGALNGTITSLMDLMPTFLELAGRKTVSGEKLSPVSAPLRGHSLVALANNPDASVRSDEDVLGMEFLGRRAIIQGDWKLLFIKGPLGTSSWELYNLSNDMRESNNLAERLPEKVTAMKILWKEYMQNNNVILPEGPIHIRED